MIGLTQLTDYWKIVDFSLISGLDCWPFVDGHWNFLCVVKCCSLHFCSFVTPFLALAPLLFQNQDMFQISILLTLYVCVNIYCGLLPITVVVRIEQSDPVLLSG